jgi:hypothetical protein
MSKQVFALSFWDVVHSLTSYEPYTFQGAASRWSAHRIRDETGDIFNAVKAAKEGRPVFFTGEVSFGNYSYILRHMLF